jgi:hypothetical protein
MQQLLLLLVRSYKMDKINYKVTTDQFGQEIISYEKDGFLYSFAPDPANSDYQAYLKRDEAEQSTPSVTNGD